MKVDIQTTKPWKRILQDFNKGDVDIVIGAYWNAERAKKYLISEALGVEKISVFVKAGKQFPLSSFRDLIGRTGLRLLGGSLGQEFDTYAEKNLDFSRISTNDQITKMLAHDRADYGIQGHAQGLHFIKSLGLESKVDVLPWPILSNKVHVLISKTARCANRVDEINAAIRKMQEEGLLEQYYQKHLALDWGGRK